MELRQCVVQIRSREDPTTAEWVPSNEEVDSAQFYIDERLVTGDYALLQLAALSTAFTTHSVAVGLYGVTTDRERAP